MVLLRFIDPRIFDFNDIHRPHPGPQDNMQIGGVRWRGVPTKVVCAEGMKMCCLGGKNTVFNPLPTNDCKTRHETFTFMMSHPAMSLGDRLCTSRKGGAGGDGWVHPKGANSMAVSGLSFEQPLVGAG